MNSNICIDELSLISMEYESPEANHQQRDLYSQTSPFDYDSMHNSVNNQMVSKTNDTITNEYDINYDIFGNRITFPREVNILGSDDSKETDNNSSENKKRDNILISILFNEKDSNPDQDSELAGEKENLDPFGNLITPLKPRRKIIGSNTGSMGSRTYSGRSPLQDITPDLGKKKIDQYKIEV